MSRSAVANRDQMELVGSPARARTSDHDTSHEAASTVEAANVRELVLAALIRGPATDEQIIERVRAYFPDRKVTEQSIRSRRCELVRLGKVAFAGEHSVTSNGGRTRVWRLAGSGVGGRSEVPEVTSPGTGLVQLGGKPDSIVSDDNAQGDPAKRASTPVPLRRMP